MTQQDRYDEAMFDYSMGDLNTAMTKLKDILRENPQYFDAQFSLAMCCCRRGDFAAAIAEGHKAEALAPKDPLVHTNLSLFYMKAGDKQKAEHHGTLARMASWRNALAQSSSTPSSQSGLNWSKAIESQDIESEDDGFDGGNIRL